MNKLKATVAKLATILLSLLLAPLALPSSLPLLSLPLSPPLPPPLSPHSPVSSSFPHLYSHDIKVMQPPPNKIADFRI